MKCTSKSSVSGGFYYPDHLPVLGMTTFVYCAHPFQYHGSIKKIFVVFKVPLTSDLGPENLALEILSRLS